MRKYFLAIILGIGLLIPLLGLAASVQFTEDTVLSLSGLSTTLYAKSGSKCDSLTVSGSTLTVDVPAGSSFTLKTASHDVLALTPSGGSVVLTFNTAYFAGGYVSQWTASSSVSSASVIFSVGVSENNVDYLVKVDGSNLDYYLSDSSGIVSFNYTGGFSAKTFTITREDRPGGAGSGGGVTTVTDTTPPSISGIESVPSDTTAVISWTTNEPSISWVVYGTSTDYGSEEKTTSYTTSHSLTLEGLNAETTYHYQVKSEDSAGNIGTYTDETFTTLTGAEEKEKAPTKEETVKPVSEMTAEEIKAKIAEITSAIKKLQALLAQMEAKPAIEGIPASFTFKRNLKFGDVSTDVRYLQIVLNSASDTRLALSGVGSPGHETKYLGPLTKAAVIRFQQKYASEILTPWGLTRGTGFVGKTTRKKLNELLK